MPRRSEQIERQDLTPTSPDSAYDATIGLIATVTGNREFPDSIRQRAFLLKDRTPDWESEGERYKTSSAIDCVLTLLRFLYTEITDPNHKEDIYYIGKEVKRWQDELDHLRSELLSKKKN